MSSGAGVRERMAESIAKAEWFGITGFPYDGNDPGDVQHWPNVLRSARETANDVLNDVLSALDDLAVQCEVRCAISDAYYEARNDCRTMESAADDARDAAVAVVKRHLAGDAQ